MGLSQPGVRQRREVIRLAAKTVSSLYIREVRVAALRNVSDALSMSDQHQKRRPSRAVYPFTRPLLLVSSHNSSVVPAPTNYGGNPI